MAIRQLVKEGVKGKFVCLPVLRGLGVGAGNLCPLCCVCLLLLLALKGSIAQGMVISPLLRDGCSSSRANWVGSSLPSSVCA